MMKMLKKIIAIAAVIMVAAVCVPAVPVIHDIAVAAPVLHPVIQPANPTLVSGNSMQFSASLEPTETYESADMTIESVSWYVHNKNIATVDGNGKLTALSAGSTKFDVNITVYGYDADGKYYYGTYKGSTTVSVREPEPLRQLNTVTIDQAVYEYTGKAITPPVTVTNSSGVVLNNGTDYTVAYSNNTNVGTAIIKVTGIGNYEGSKTISFEIRKTPKDLSNANIAMSQTTWAYTGKAITPSVTVYYGSTILTNGTDFTTSYSNNVDVGTGTITITGKGDYTGTKTATFEIKKTIKGLGTVKIEKSVYEYTGNAITPTVTVTDASGNILVKDTDYTVSYSNNTNVGTASITVKGKGNYEGGKTLTFEIVKEKAIKVIASATVEKEQYTYTGSAIRPVITAKDAEGILLKENTDFVVNYSNNKTPGYAVVKVEGVAEYKGSALTASFKIVPNKTRLYKPRSARKSFRLKWKKQSFQTTGYAVQYSTNSDFRDETTKYVKSRKTTKLTVKGLKTKTKYFVRIATYKTVDGEKILSEWSAKKSVKTK